MNKILVHHHLGLGDHIICNGLINYLSKSKKIYLICKIQYYKNINYLYSQNKNVVVVPLTKFMYKSTKSEKRFSRIYSNLLRSKILYLGFNQQKGEYFDELFYKHAAVDFSNRYDSFHVPENSVNMIEKPDVEFRLVHRESSIKNYNLKIKSDDLLTIFVTRELGKNIFSYIDLIRSATEIHCVDSAFIHLVDSFGLSSNLYFHNIRKDDYRFNFKNNWKVINYE